MYSKSVRFASAPVVRTRPRMHSVLISVHSASVRQTVRGTFRTDRGDRAWLKGGLGYRPDANAASTAASACRRVVAKTGTGLCSGRMRSSISVQPRMMPSAPEATSRLITSP